MLVEIARADDERLTDFRDLTDVALRTRIEPPNGVFIAEGEPVIRRALAAGFSPRAMVMAPEWADRMRPLIDDVAAPVFTAPYDVLRELTGFHVHRGALAAFHRKPLPDADGVIAGAHRLVVLEDIVSHTNLGAIFRCAAALGMDGVLLSPSCADPLYRRSVRVSMGEVFAIPYARAEAWPDALRDLRSGGFRTLALTPDDDAVPLDDLDVGDERIAVVLGTEGRGLTDAAISRCDLAVRIPMAAGVDSLNVGAAAAVAFWVLGGRRRHAHAGSGR